LAQATLDPLVRPMHTEGMTAINVRDLRFDLAEVPRDWHPAGSVATTFFDNLSIFFPPGERFFIASVKAHRGFIGDDALRADVVAFCTQEGIHSREHAAYNRLLERGGIPATQMEGRIASLLAKRNETVPARRQLAATVALEHFTAIMAHVLLSQDELLDGADPQMAALWRWHAIEEIEHKAVAFDVYRAAGGTYSERAAAMVLSTLIFFLQLTGQQFRIMRARRNLFDVRGWVSFLRYSLIKPAWMARLIPLYLEFFRRDFHPTDQDNRELLQSWQSELEAEAA